MKKNDAEMVEAATRRLVYIDWIGIFSTHSMLKTVGVGVLCKIIGSPVAHGSYLIS